MKQYLLLALLAVSSFLVSAQKSDSTAQFGFTINSSFNGEIYPIRVVPSVTYFKGKNQLEVGFGMHPYIRKDQKILSGEINYKNYPNGTGNKFNLYFIARFSYVNNKRNTYFPTSYNYLFLNGGYGFEVSPFKGAYLGTNISCGTFTYNKDSENPYNTMAPKKLFKEFGFDLAFQFNIGYRF